MIYIKLTVSEKKYTTNGGLPWALNYFLYNTKGYSKSELSCKIYPISDLKDNEDGCLIVIPEHMQQKMLDIIYEKSTKCKLLISLGYKSDPIKCHVSKDPSDFYRWLQIPDIQHRRHGSVRPGTRAYRSRGREAGL